MQTNVYLPQLELTMESVTVTNVRVQEGAQVAVEQPLIEVESEKAIAEIPAPKAGYVRKILVKADDQIGGNALLCILTDTRDEPFQDPTGPVPAAAAATQRSARADAGPSPLAAATGSALSEGPIKAAPAARKLAKDLGLDLSTVAGTGPGGRITLEDVQKARNLQTPQPTASDWVPLSLSRRALIAQMQKSLAEIPQFHIARQLEVAPLLTKSEGVTFTHRLVRAVAAALSKHPALRTVIDGNRIRVEPVSVAIAMDTPRGLVAPALRHADTLSLEQIAALTKDFQRRAEAGALRREEFLHAPFAISNLGMFGVDFFHAFVFHGQTAVLAVGRAVGSRAWFSLAVDHRVVNGVEAARFLETLQQEILRS
ncbi:MAG: 2-oxo acid dehydrogenase subunit E2 [Verrucomicrobia bacterium]|nr:2-oxo acid dehydrogenase subunit E2 [Verrucomicrobiota bacterium]